MYVHFLVIHAVTQFIQHGIIGHSINICIVLICIRLGKSLNKIVVYDYQREKEREGV